MDAQKTGKLINYLRSKKGLTQKQLAEQVNVSDKAVSKWERGDGCPDVGLLPTLAQVLETDVDSLLKGELPARKVLTEEEMKAMLAKMEAASGNEDKTDRRFLKNQNARILIYDFKRPSIFSKYQMRMICNLFVSTICEKLRSDILSNRNDIRNIQIVSVDELTNAEFLRTIPQRNFFYNYDYNNFGFAVEIDPQIGKVILKQDAKKYPEVTQTDLDCLELAFVNPFVRLMQNAFYENTDKSISQAEFDKSLTESTVLPVVFNGVACGERLEEMCLLVTLCLESDSESGMINIQFNYAYFCNFCRKLGFFGREEDNIQLHYLTDIKTKLVENNVFVELGRYRSDSFAFEPGSIFVTQKRAGEPFNVVIEKQVRFTGETVVIDNNFGTRIVCKANDDDKILYNEDHYIAIRLGETFIPKEDFDKIGEGTVLELNTLAGEALSIIQDGKCIARGEIVIIDDLYGIRICD